MFDSHNQQTFNSDVKKCDPLKNRLEGTAYYCEKHIYALHNSGQTFLEEKMASLGVDDEGNT